MVTFPTVELASECHATRHFLEGRCVFTQVLDTMKDEQIQPSNAHQMEDTPTKTSDKAVYRPTRAKYARSNLAETLPFHPLISRYVECMTAPDGTYYYGMSSKFFEPLVVDVNGGKNCNPLISHTANPDRLVGGLLMVHGASKERQHTV